VSSPPRGLDERGLAPSWQEQFERWYEETVRAGLYEPDAMVLASADSEGRPSARTVLLKGFDERGFVFFTNLASRKGSELAQNPSAALLFPWYQLGRQVIVAGEVSGLEAQAADEYFATRAYGSQIGAYASRQSSVISGRDALERERERMEARHPRERPVPRPPWWGGLRLAPDSVEFWQGRPDRLHDRLRYRRRENAEEWLIERLSP
jgi:pyridoxamine 5'-phosphate oxidase